MQRIAAGASLWFRDQANRISRLAATGKHAHISRECGLYLITARSLPPMYCHSTFFVLSIGTYLISCNDNCWSLTAQLNGVAFEKTNDYCTFNIFSQLHSCLMALYSYASMVSIFRRCQAACNVSVASCSSASIWASLLRPRPGLLRS